MAPPLPFHHLSVLPLETVEALAPAPGKVIVDATLGGGGHTGLLLEKGATVIAIDQDAEARFAAGGRHRDFVKSGQLRILAGRFGDLADLARRHGFPKLDGILADIGVSSHQLDSAERGFSFQKDGPLDMRMNPEAGESVANLLARIDEAELIRILREYGEEKSARKIASWTLEQQVETPWTRTLPLAEGLEKLLGGRRGRTHPATKTFQALRIAVNDELGELERLLDSAASLLKPGGRLAIITFQSLEDRITKRFFRKHSDTEIDRPEWPAPRPNPDLQYRLISRGGITASPEELAENPRSRSARLRVVERLP